MMGQQIQFAKLKDALAHSLPDVEKRVFLCLSDRVLYYSSSKTLTSFDVFFALASLHSGQRSGATIPFIQLSQNEKSIRNLLSF